MENSSERKRHDPHLIIVDVAERLFSQNGFQRTTIADIARELHMSSANVYRFFSEDFEIQAAVGRRLFREVEAAVDDIVKHSGQASKKLRASIAAVEKANAERFAINRKLQELLEVAFNENWVIARQHVQKLDAALADIISQGHRDGEFRVEDCERKAIVVRTACMQFYHPLLMVNRAQEPGPSTDQMVDFCIAALVSTLGDRSLAGWGEA